MGIVSPVGSTVNRAWDTITAGKSGITNIDCFDASAFSVQIAGQTRDFNVDDYLSKKINENGKQNGNQYTKKVTA